MVFFHIRRHLPATGSAIRLTLGLVLSAAVLFAGPAAAGAFDATVSAELRLTAINAPSGIAGLDITLSDTTLVDLGSYADGDASVDLVDDPLGVGVGFDALLMSATSGNGKTIGNTEANAVIGLENVRRAAPCCWTMR
ncbi:MAG: hypothetical protein N838_30995 [Thiohalocapsa sp. PB-PSB1]|jgi:hypothetical protein|nr:MAG: hypothetical protein N838_20320 [Thiohalocapsa sp. PB-PSB1]QQO57121.1 MAG: hypothetical protein N838_30995 [Thiohalocapsa sp. PB-PSB1]HCS90776.1 hypothetical protein [Chromatiaceae bacterium]